MKIEKKTIKHCLIKIPLQQTKTFFFKIKTNNKKTKMQFKYKQFY